jgi:hypothetical protein
VLERCKFVSIIITAFDVVIARHRQGLSRVTGFKSRNHLTMV